MGKAEAETKTKAKVYPEHVVAAAKRVRRQAALKRDEDSERKLEAFVRHVLDLAEARADPPCLVHSISTTMFPCAGLTRIEEAIAAAHPDFNVDVSRHWSGEDYIITMTPYPSLMDAVSETQ